MTSQPPEQPPKSRPLLVCPQGHHYPLQAGVCPSCPLEDYPVKKPA